MRVLTHRYPNAEYENIQAENLLRIAHVDFQKVGSDNLPPLAELTSSMMQPPLWVNQGSSNDSKLLPGPKPKTEQKVDDGDASMAGDSDSDQEQLEKRRMISETQWEHEENHTNISDVDHEWRDFYRAQIADDDLDIAGLGWTNEKQFAIRIVSSTEKGSQMVCVYERDGNQIRRLRGTIQCMEYKRSGVGKKYTHILHLTDSDGGVRVYALLRNTGTQIVWGQICPWTDSILKEVHWICCTKLQQQTWTVEERRAHEMINTRVGFYATQKEVRRAVNQNPHLKRAKPSPPLAQPVPPAGVALSDLPKYYDGLHDADLQAAIAESMKSESDRQSQLSQQGVVKDEHSDVSKKGL